MVSDYIDQYVHQPNCIRLWSQRQALLLAAVQVIPMLLQWNQDLVHDGVFTGVPQFHFSSFFGLPIPCDTNRSFGKYLAAPRPPRETVDTPAFLYNIIMQPAHDILIGLPQYKHYLTHACCSETRACWRLGERGGGGVYRNEMSDFLMISFFFFLSRLEGLGVHGEGKYLSETGFTKHVAQMFFSIIVQNCGTK